MSSVGLRCGRTSLMLLISWLQPFQRVVLALDRDQHLLGRHERVDRQQADDGGQSMKM